MKITNSVVKLFEQEQRNHGTKVALFNFVWLLYNNALKQLTGGVRITRKSTKKR